LSDSNNSKKITQELNDIKDYLIDNKLKNVNFDTLDLTEIADEDDLSAISKSQKEERKSIHPAKASQTIHEMVAEILRPELKKWLDTNLPAIVKQAVNEEIKKFIPKND
jgi:cell pole-organizing protein PopZ